MTAVTVVEQLEKKSSVFSISQKDYESIGPEACLNRGLWVDMTEASSTSIFTTQQYFRLAHFIKYYDVDETTKLAQSLGICQQNVRKYSW